MPRASRTASRWRRCGCRRTARSVRERSRKSSSTIIPADTSACMRRWSGSRKTRTIRPRTRRCRRPAAEPRATPRRPIRAASTGAAAVRCRSSTSRTLGIPTMETTMYRTLIALSLSAVCSVSAFAQNAATETQRDTNQQNRVEQGLKSGQLTTREAGQLERDEQRIDRTQARDLKNGPLTSQEEAQIQREQNQASRQIYQDKHNAVTGNPNSKSSERMQADVQRNANQQARINQGIRSGQLS